MKIQITPNAAPIAIHLQYSAEVAFSPERSAMVEVMAGFNLDDNDPFHATRFGLNAEVLQDVPLGTDLKELVKTIESHANVWTPFALQFWPQYLQQPAEIRKMPKMGLMLQKITADAMDFLKAFMKGKNDFHAFYVADPDSHLADEGVPEFDKLPEFDGPDGKAWLVKLYWLDAAHTDLWAEAIRQDTLETSRYCFTDFRVDTLCALCDMIPYWKDVIKANN